MPRDQRLYMTFPIDFHRHPKVSRLSDAAFRAFVEANGESRIAESDGRIDAPDAEFMWKPEALQELVDSHPSRPLVLRDGDAYVIRDYAEHQFTKADREALTEKRAKAGRASANARRARAEQVLNESQHPPTESESESGLGDYYPPSKSQSLDTRARVSTDAFEVSEVTKAIASQAGIKDLAVIAHAIGSRLGVHVDAHGAMAVARHLLDKAARYPDAPERYVLTCIDSSPAEVEQFIHNSGLAA
jgi:hypothetical protein